MPEQQSERLSQPEDRGAKCFVAIGECMVEMAPSEAGGQFRMSFAGDTFNTAWYLRQLEPGWTSRFFTRIGDDAVSRDMLDAMQRAGVDTSHIRHSTDRSVGLYLISLVNGERSFSYWRNQSAARQLADDRAALEAAVADADIVYFSGISLGILSPEARRTLLEVAASARTAGKMIAFDPNLRPRLWASTEEMCDAVTQASAVSDLILPSFDDEASYFGDADIEATRDRYLASGATTVIVKNGPGETLFAHDGKTGKVLPPPVGEIADTTAAGDSFNAGFLASFSSGRPVEEAISAGAGVAARVIAERGALVPLDH